MIINVSDETREKINKEFARFMEDPNNMARLKMKLTYNQRVFLETFKDAAHTDSENVEAKDRDLLFQQSMLMFNAKPELVPNAPIELLKKNITFQKKTDDFEQLLIIMKVWISSVKKSKRPVNRLAAVFARWSKLPLYAFFVFILTASFTAGIHILELFLFAKPTNIFEQIAILISSGFFSVSAAKGIILRILAENELKK